MNHRQRRRKYERARAHRVKMEARTREEREAREYTGTGKPPPAAKRRGLTKRLRRAIGRKVGSQSESGGA